MLLEIITEHGVLGAKLASRPLEPNYELATSAEPFFDHPERYHRLIGKLIYLTVTHPQLSYAVHILA